MGMQYIRKTYGVPCYRGALVRPKSGQCKGLLGRIRSTREGRIVVTDVEYGRAAWWGMLHPDDREYMQPNA